MLVLTNVTWYVTSGCRCVTHYAINGDDNIVIKLSVTNVIVFVTSDNCDGGNINWNVYENITHML